MPMTTRGRLWLAHKVLGCVEEQPGRYEVEARAHWEGRYTKQYNRHNQEYQSKRHGHVTFSFHDGHVGPGHAVA